MTGGFAGILCKACALANETGGIGVLSDAAQGEDEFDLAAGAVELIRDIAGGMALVGKGVDVGVAGIGRWLVVRGAIHAVAG